MRPFLKRQNDNPPNTCSPFALDKNSKRPSIGMHSIYRCKTCNQSISMLWPLYKSSIITTSIKSSLCQSSSHSNSTKPLSVAIKQPHVNLSSVFANSSCMKRPQLGICQIASSRCYSGYRCDLINSEHTVRLGCCLQAKRKNGEKRKCWDSDGSFWRVKARPEKGAKHTD